MGQNRYPFVRPSGTTLLSLFLPCSQRSVCSAWFRSAGGDKTTAYAILRYVGTADVIIASVVVLVPFAVVWAMIWLIVQAVDQRDLHTYAGFIAITGVTALAIAPPAVLVIAAGTGLLFIRSLVVRRTDRATVQRAILFVLLLVSASLIAYRDVWLPPEIIKTDGSVHVGYVLNDDDPASLVVLRHDNRQVIRIATAAVETRSFCEIRPSGPDWFNRTFDTPLPALLRKEADYPECSAAASGAKEE